jgi:hypothetical protein
MLLAVTLTNTSSTKSYRDLYISNFSTTVVGSYPLDQVLES